MAQSGNHFLRYSNRTADGALLTLFQTGFGTGGSNRFQSNIAVVAGSGPDFGSFVVTILTCLSQAAIGGTGCLHDSGFQIVILLCGGRLHNQSLATDRADLAFGQTGFRTGGFHRGDDLLGVAIGGNDLLCGKGLTTDRALHAGGQTGVSTIGSLCRDIYLSMTEHRIDLMIAGGFNHTDGTVGNLVIAAVHITLSIDLVLNLYFTRLVAVGLQVAGAIRIQCPCVPCVERTVTDHGAILIGEEQTAGCTAALIAFQITGFVTIGRLAGYRLVVVTQSDIFAAFVTLGFLPGLQSLFVANGLSAILILKEHAAVDTLIMCLVTVGGTGSSQTTDLFTGLMAGLGFCYDLSVAFGSLCTALTGECSLAVSGTIGSDGYFTLVVVMTQCIHVIIHVGVVTADTGVGGVALVVTGRIGNDSIVLVVQSSSDMLARLDGLLASFIVESAQAGLTLIVLNVAFLGTGCVHSCYMIHVVSDHIHRFGVGVGRIVLTGEGFHALCSTGGLGGYFGSVVVAQHGQGYFLSLGFKQSFGKGSNALAGTVSLTSSSSHYFQSYSCCLTCLVRIVVLANGQRSAGSHILTPVISNGVLVAQSLDILGISVAGIILTGKGHDTSCFTSRIFRHLGLIVVIQRLQEACAALCLPGSQILNGLRFFLILEGCTTYCTLPVFLHTGAFTLCRNFIGLLQIVAQCGDLTAGCLVTLGSLGVLPYRQFHGDFVCQFLLGNLSSKVLVTDIAEVSLFIAGFGTGRCLAVDFFNSVAGCGDLVVHTVQLCITTGTVGCHLVRTGVDAVSFLAVLFLSFACNVCCNLETVSGLFLTVALGNVAIYGLREGTAGDGDLSIFILCKHIGGFPLAGAIVFSSFESTAGNRELAAFKCIDTAVLTNELTAVNHGFAPRANQVVIVILNFKGAAINGQFTSRLNTNTVEAIHNNGTILNGQVTLDDQTVVAVNSRDQNGNILVPYLSFFHGNLSEQFDGITSSSSFNSLFQSLVSGRTNSGNRDQLSSFIDNLVGMSLIILTGVGRKTICVEGRCSVNLFVIMAQLTKNLSGL